MGEDEGQTNPVNNYLNGVIKVFFFFYFRGGNVKCSCLLASPLRLSLPPILYVTVTINILKMLKLPPAGRLEASHWVYTLLLFFLLKVDLSLFL